ncbi:hypothetical protein G3A39_42745 [Paraburkholderia aspalathi]|nr:hypothetical protein [Paraburkholderia aspalathi]
MRKYRIKQITYFDGFAAGMFFASIVFLIVFMILDFPITGSAWVAFFGSIIVSIFSITAAFLALRGNRLQIKQTNDIEDERRRNSLIASKAVLPAILSQICSLASNNLRLHFPPVAAPIGGNLAPAITYQPLPDDLIPAFKECIEYADCTSQERLANILRHIQVAQARRKVPNDYIMQQSVGLAPLTLELHTAISESIGWAVIYALTEDAFAFARGSDNPIPAAIKPERVRGAFIQSSIPLETFPNLVHTLKLRSDGGRLEIDWMQN